MESLQEDTFRELFQVFLLVWRKRATAGQSTELYFTLHLLSLH